MGLVPVCSLRFSFFWDQWVSGGMSFWQRQKENKASPTIQVHFKPLLTFFSINPFVKVSHMAKVHRGKRKRAILVEQWPNLPRNIIAWLTDCPNILYILWHILYCFCSGCYCNKLKCSWVPGQPKLQHFSWIINKPSKTLFLLSKRHITLKFYFEMFS